MRRIVKRTITVTSVETWTISFERRLALEDTPDEALALNASVPAAKGDDPAIEQAPDRAAEPVQPIDAAHSAAEERPADSPSTGAG